MSKRTWIVAVAAAVIAVVIAIIIVNSTEKWRPDQENWPPSQVVDDPEMADAPEELTPQEDVTWSDYRAGFKKDIDKAGDTGDCAALDRYFGEALNTETPDRLALTYIDKWETHLNCPAEDEQGKEAQPTKSGPPEAYGLCEPEGETGKTPGGTVVVCRADDEGTLRWQKPKG